MKDIYSKYFNKASRAILAEFTHRISEGKVQASKVQAVLLEYLNNPKQSELLTKNMLALFGSADIIDNVIAKASTVNHSAEAILILLELDPSLRQSVKIASRLGYKTYEVSSTLLASLLIEDYLQDELFTLIDTVLEALEDCFLIS